MVAYVYNKKYYNKYNKRYRFWRKKETDKIFITTKSNKNNNNNNDNNKEIPQTLNILKYLQLFTTKKKNHQKNLGKYILKNKIFCSKGKL